MDCSVDAVANCPRSSSSWGGQSPGERPGEEPHALGYHCATADVLCDASERWVSVRINAEDGTAIVTKPTKQCSVARYARAPGGMK